MYSFKSPQSPKSYQSPQSPVKEDVYWERRGPFTPPRRQYQQNKYYFADRNTPSKTPKTKKGKRTKLGPTKFPESSSSNSNSEIPSIPNTGWSPSMETPPRTPVGTPIRIPFNIPDANNENTPSRRTSPKERNKKYSKSHGSIKLPASWKNRLKKWQIETLLKTQPFKRRYYTTQVIKTLPRHIPKTKRR